MRLEGQVHLSPRASYAKLRHLDLSLLLTERTWKGLNVKNCGGSEILTLQTNKLACYSFMNGHKTPGAETKDLVTRGTAGSLRLKLVLVHLAL